MYEVDMLYSAVGADVMGIFICNMIWEVNPRLSARELREQWNIKYWTSFGTHSSFQASEHWN